MLNILIISYFLLFLFLAWKNFRLAIILFIVFLPTYLVRFQVGPLPSTALELSFGALFLVWLVKYSRYDIKNIIAAVKKHKILFIAFCLFFLSSIASVLISDLLILSLGVWRAYFLEPMIFFLILIGRGNGESPLGRGGRLKATGVGDVVECMATQAASPTPTPPKRGILTASDLIWGLALSTVSISIYCIVQKFTGLGIATPEWTAVATRRVTAFFSSPNAVGLYLAPVLMLMTTVIARKSWRLTKQSQNTGSADSGIVPIANRGSSTAAVGTTSLWILAMTALAVLAVIFTKSQGTWIGLAAGLLVYLFFLNYKKTVAVVAVLGVILALLIPAMRQAILFKDQAGQNRLRLLGYTQIFLSKSPQNFILGTGLGEFFRKVQKPYYNDKIMERLIFPHSIFINFWTETGLLGMLAITIILGYTFYLANKIRMTNKLVGAGLLGMLTVLVVHGLVDVPYFKNDLAFLFWIIMAIPFYCDPIFHAKSHTPQPPSRGEL